MILGEMAERRPAWLWTQNGETLLWRNPAARLFKAKIKKHKSPQPKTTIPIKGQVRRLMRLGSIGLPSLARVRFLVGQKPASATCTCTPVLLESGEPALLIVGTDEIEKSLFRNLELPDPLASALFGGGKEHLFFDEHGRVFSGSAHALEEWKDRKFRQGGIWELLLDTDNSEFGLAVREAGRSAPDDGSDERTTAPEHGKKGERGAISEKKTSKESPADPKLASTQQLSGLLDQLADSSGLFEPLKEDTSEERLAARVKAHPQGKQVDTGLAPGPAEPTNQWRVTGRNFASTQMQAGGEPALPLATDNTEFTTDAPSQGEGLAGSDKSGDPEIDRVARYNFEELSRLLSDRVGKDSVPLSKTKPVSATTPEAVRDTVKGPREKTIKLSEELLVLNRLPIGILIFRDQSILFANRALADIMGSPSISRLREGGLDAIFPQIDDETATLGPVAHLLDINGEEVPVAARLQTIVWQGRSALMLSAQPETSVNGDGEANVKAFVRAQAATQNEGYFETDRDGTITQVSAVCARLFKRERTDLIGRTLLEIGDEKARPALREFLKRPAKSAETVRPHITVSASKPSLRINLFAQGRAGLVSGYFGTVSAGFRTVNSELEASIAPDTELLGRLSRGIRRPLNSIIGFSELVQSEAFGPQGNQRYREYARDIRAAGLEISHLVDEVDEFVLLQSSKSMPETTDFNLGDLLDESLRLVRRQASLRQVLVRSAISEDISNVSADRATMRQAILNLLASAIDQSPPGGKVILSAQSEPDGSIGVHVRNSDTQPDGPGDRFVVFREADKTRDESMVPLKSSMGLTLTRSLLAANECLLSINPSAGAGTLMTLVIPAGRVSGMD